MCLGLIPLLASHKARQVAGDIVKPMLGPIPQLMIGLDHAKVQPSTRAPVQAGAPQLPAAPMYGSNPMAVNSARTGLQSAIVGMLGQRPPMMANNPAAQGGII